MYDRILFPTDGSEAAEQAAREALDLAAAHGATLHVLHVADTAAVTWATSDDEVSMDPTPLTEGLLAAGERYVDREADPAADRGVETVTAVTEGRAARGIVASTTPPTRRSTSSW